MSSKLNVEWLNNDVITGIFQRRIMRRLAKPATTNYFFFTRNKYSTVFIILEFCLPKYHGTKDTHFRTTFMHINNM